MAEATAQTFAEVVAQEEAEMEVLRARLEAAMEDLHGEVADLLTSWGLDDRDPVCCACF